MLETDQYSLSLEVLAQNCHLIILSRHTSQNCHLFIFASVIRLIMVSRLLCAHQLMFDTTNITIISREHQIRQVNIGFE